MAKNHPTQLLKQIDEEVLQAELAERSLLRFMTFMWKAFKGEELMINWHHAAVADHLEAAMRFEIKNLIINIPPRHTKSVLTSACLTPWQWIHNPASKFLYASHSLDLSIRDSVYSRDIIKSPLYQKYWGDKFQLTADQNAKKRYSNQSSGFRFSTSVTGG